MVDAYTLGPEDVTGTALRKTCRSKPTKNHPHESMFLMAGWCALRSPVKPCDSAAVQRHHTLYTRRAQRDGLQAGIRTQAISNFRFPICNCRPSFENDPKLEIGNWKLE